MSLRLLAALLVVTLGGCGRANPPSPEPTPTCGGCHEAERRGWEASLHGPAAFASVEFQASYREEPPDTARTFCIGCHTPGGVRCEGCHPNAAAHARAPRADRATSSACGRCHDFSPPEGRGEVRPASRPEDAVFLQATEHEHRASPFADVACAECHMPGGDHRFAVSRNASFLARAVEVGPARLDGDDVVVELRAAGVGHRFPTGDIFRQLSIRAEVEDASGKILVDRELAAHRDWDAVRQGRPERYDTRLGDAPTRLVLPLPPEARGELRVAVHVVYERGFEARSGRLATFASVPIANRAFGVRR